MKKPVIAIVTDVAVQPPHAYHQAGDKYIQAVRRCCDATPILIPSLTESPLNIDEILSVADGVLFTGGYSNIQPRNYGAPAAPDGEFEDPARDKNTLGLLPAVLDAGLPMLGICRGLQEMNVALGGTLFSRLHEQDGRFDHREDKNAPLDVQYGPAHSVTIREGSILHTIIGYREFMVNTVHGQGIDRLADGLVIEATADDDTIEAVHMPSAPGFNLAVQWHPEWKAWENTESTKIFAAFRDAARTYKAAKAA